MKDPSEWEGLPDRAKSYLRHLDDGQTLPNARRLAHVTNKQIENWAREYSAFRNAVLKVRTT